MEDTDNTTEEVDVQGTNYKNRDFVSISDSI